MKRFCLPVMTSLFAFGLGVIASALMHKLDTQSTSEIKAIRLMRPCLDKVELRQEPGATAKLRTLEVRDSLDPGMEIAIENTGPKQIRAYDVGVIEDYQYEKNIESSQGIRAHAGVLLDVGEKLTLEYQGGCASVQSNSGPTGTYQHSVWWIKRLDYTDGTSWVSQLRRCSCGNNEPSRLCAAQ